MTKHEYLKKKYIGKPFTFYDRVAKRIADVEHVVIYPDKDFFVLIYNGYELISSPSDITHTKIRVVSNIMNAEINFLSRTGFEGWQNEVLFADPYLRKLYNLPVVWGGEYFRIDNLNVRLSCNNEPREVYPSLVPSQPDPNAIDIVNMNCGIQNMMNDPELMVAYYITTYHANGKKNSHVQQAFTPKPPIY